MVKKNEYAYLNVNNMVIAEKNENVVKWCARKKIALGVARGLRYLHEECRVGCIVHGDIRPCNIFLTHYFEALLCLNFNMKMAPEYTESGEITEKADVYSFGVLLLELLTGRKAFHGSHHCLHQWVSFFEFQIIEYPL